MEGRSSMKNNEHNHYEEWRTAQHMHTGTYEMNVFNDYEVSNLGRFRNKNNGKVIEGSLNNVGRTQVMIAKKRYQLHRIVASTFLLNDNPTIKKVVMHIDSNPLNNSVSNLKWGTQSENLSDPKRAEALKASAGWIKNNKKSKKPIFVFDTQKMKGAIYESNTNTATLLNIDKTTAVYARKNKHKVKNRYFITTNQSENNVEEQRVYEILENFRGVA